MSSKTIGHAAWTGGLRIAASLATLFLMTVFACKKTEAPSGAVSAPAPAPADVAKISAGSPVSAQVTLKVGASSGLLNPRGVAVDGSGNIYVVDTGNNRVVKLDASGKELLTFGKKGSGPGQFLQASVTAISPQGNLLVLDSETSWIQVFGPGGKFLNRIGGPDMSFYHPAGMAVSADGTVAVADTGGNRLVLIDSEGKLKGTPITAVEKQPLSQPTEVFFDPRGRIHVYQTAGQKTPSVLYHLTDKGNLEGKWSAPDAPSTLDTPRAALAADGRLYVTDPANQKIRVYDASGSSYHLLLLEGSDLPRFKNLSGIALDPQGRVYVADAGANVVYRLQLSAPR